MAKNDPDRDKRLAEALRANLRRRKAGDRGEAASSNDTAEQSRPDEARPTG